MRTLLNIPTATTDRTRIWSFWAGDHRAQGSQLDVHASPLCAAATKGGASIGSP